MLASDVIGANVTGIETETTTSTGCSSSRRRILTSQPTDRLAAVNCTSSSSSSSDRSATHQLTAATVHCAHTTTPSRPSTARLIRACWPGRTLPDDVGRHGLACQSSAVDPAGRPRQTARQRTPATLYLSIHATLEHCDILVAPRT